MKYLGNVDNNKDVATKEYVDSKHITKAGGTLSVAGWSDGTQTISVSGVDASKDVLIGVDPDNIPEYRDSGIYCTAIGSGTLTFICSSVPTEAISLYFWIC